MPQPHAHRDASRDGGPPATVLVTGATSGIGINGKRTRSSTASYDESAAARLWRVSADLVGHHTAR
jgi:hypothetical protein